MAGMDYTRQRAARQVNLQWNVGNFDFSAGSTTVDVPTTLAQAVGGLAMADLTAEASPQETFLGYKVGDISNGAITFTRGGAAAAHDARMAYVLFGW